MITLPNFLVAITVIAIIYQFFKKRNGPNLPPGPFKWPLVGNVLQMGQMAHVKLGEWSQKYGKLFTIGFGPISVVVISDAELIREAFNDPNFSGRVDHELFTIFSGGKHGIVSTDGPEWVEQRRWTLRHLRDFGFGTNYMESLITDEVTEYMTFLEANEGQSISLERRFNMAFLNSLWMILAGKRYNHDDPRLHEIFDRNLKVVEEVASKPHMLATSLCKMFPKISGWQRILDLVADTRTILVGHIEEHKKDFDKDSPPRDFIDSYLQEIDSTTNPTSTFYKETGEKSLVSVMADLFTAGAESTSSTLQFSVLYLAKFPEIQLKVQEELDRVVGRNRRPTLADRAKLLYCEATNWEVLRYSSITPLGFFHTTVADVKFHGYDIPKGTWVAPNQGYLHFSPDLWDNPQAFEPARHLHQENGETVLKRNNAFMPFSVGKRACIGELLARTELFLFFTNIFQRYNIRLAPESENVSSTPRQGFVLQPQPFNVIITKRF